MFKKYYYLILFFLFLSCEKENDSQDSPKYFMKARINGVNWEVINDPSRMSSDG